jgi:hypothetical protein
MGYKFLASGLCLRRVVMNAFLTLHNGPDAGSIGRLCGATDLVRIFFCTGFKPNNGRGLHFGDAVQYDGPTEILCHECHPCNSRVC